jgi:hypothetical protein
VSGTRPTRAWLFGKAHKRKDGSYPNEITRERYVYATHISPIFELFFINYLFTIDVVSGIINLIQHT